MSLLHGAISARSILILPFASQPVENSLLDSRGIVSQLEAVVAASAAAAKHNAEMAQATNDILPYSEPDTREDAQEGDVYTEGDADGDDSEEDEDVSSLYLTLYRVLKCDYCRLKS